MFLFSSGHGAAAAHVPRHYRRAAALTYHTAPCPSDSTECVFEALLTLAADRLDANGEAIRDGAAVTAAASSSTAQVERGTWLGRAWRFAVDYTSKSFLAARQDAFLEAFSRQLELNPAEETSTVMMSCECYLVSGGQLHLVTLFATNCGLYFCTPNVATTAAPSEESDADDGIKDRALFTDVASLLPSIFLPQRDETAAPFIQGIPSGVVAPTALQVFTVRLSTVLQFVALHNVAVKPPGKPTAEAERSGAESMHEALCTDVVRKREYNLICELPPNLDTLKFAALTERLLTQRLHEPGRPLEHPAARYAEPH